MKSASPTWVYPPAYFTHEVEGREVARCRLQERGRGWMSLEEVVTHRDHRRQGYARKVCQEALTWAGSHGKRVWLLAEPHPTGGGPTAQELQDFYHSLGFTTREEAGKGYAMEWTLPQDS